MWTSCLLNLGSSTSYVFLPLAQADEWQLKMVIFKQFSTLPFTLRVRSAALEQSICSWKTWGVIQTVKFGVKRNKENFAGFSLLSSSVRRKTTRVWLSYWCKTPSFAIIIFLWSSTHRYHFLFILSAGLPQWSWTRHISSRLYLSAKKENYNCNTTWVLLCGQGFI